jgi:hypothetical protein
VLLLLLPLLLLVSAWLWRRHPAQRDVPHPDRAVRTQNLLPCLLGFADGALARPPLLPCRTAITATALGVCAAANLGERSQPVRACPSSIS